MNEFKIMTALIVGRYNLLEEITTVVDIQGLGRRGQVRIHPDLNQSPHVDQDLMGLVIRCQATDEKDRPLLPELEQRVQNAVARPPNYYDGMAGIDPGAETDEAIEGLIRQYVLNAPTYTADEIPLPKSPINPPRPLSPIRSLLAGLQI